MPHGGPHSVFTTAFSPGCAFYAALGYASLWVNYRGSLVRGGRPVRACDAAGA